MSSRELAREIFNRHNGVSVTGRRIYLRELRHDDPPLTNENGRSSYANICDTAEGNRARTRPFLNDNRTIVPDVFLTENLLRAILVINDEFNGPGILTINTIAGGNHTQNLNDEHYLGKAVDFSSENHIVRGTGQTPDCILTRLAARGFITQRHGYVGFHNFFHLEIHGRNF